jgi:hypothetical protein
VGVGLRKQTNIEECHVTLRDLGMTSVWVQGLDLLALSWVSWELTVLLRGMRTLCLPPFARNKWISNPKCLVSHGSGTWKAFLLELTHLSHHVELEGMANTVLVFWHLGGLWRRRWEGQPPNGQHTGRLGTQPAWTGQGLWHRDTLGLLLFVILRQDFPM